MVFLGYMPVVGLLHKEIKEGFSLLSSSLPKKQGFYVYFILFYLFLYTAGSY